MGRDEPVNPEVAAPVPATSEHDGGVVVRHAAEHVFGGMGCRRSEYSISVGLEAGTFFRGPGLLLTFEHC